MIKDQKLSDTYEEKRRILISIQSGVEEILRDRVDNRLNQELKDFINELNDHHH